MKVLLQKHPIFHTKALKAFLLFTVVGMALLRAQEFPVLKAAVDTTAIRIGEQLNYTLQLKLKDSLAEVMFPEMPVFAPFEIIDQSLIDTLRTQSHYLYTKKYALIQFDSGSYWIPQQRVLVNGFSKISDSIAVAVHTVVVDTLKQKMFDIKPLEDVKRNYDTLIETVVWVLAVLFFLTGIVYVYFFQKRRRILKQQQLPPFERAIASLKALEEEVPTARDDYKAYYSELTDIVRRYLEEDAKVSALESTSQELLLKLVALKDSGRFGLKKETIKSLKLVLETADLVKFAKSLPEQGTVAKDLKTIETVIIDTQEALPEPTEEELQAQAAYQAMLAKKRRKEQWIWGLSGLVITMFLSLAVSMAVYGFYPVRDALLGYPTYKLYKADWVESQYGTPPVKAITPKVLKRLEDAALKGQAFAMGDWDSPFYIRLHFDIKPKASNKDASQSSKEEAEAAAMEKAQTYVNEVISGFEAVGATNILIKTDPKSVPSGVSGIKIHGTLDYPKKEKSERVRCNYTTLLMPFEEGSITFTVMYEKEDRYGSQIEDRIMESLDLIKEL